MAELDWTRWVGLDDWWPVEIELDLDALTGQWATHRAMARYMTRTNGLTEDENYEWIVARTVERLGRP